MKSKAVATAIVIALASALAFVGCETTTGYRKSAGGQSAHKTVKLSLKNVEIAGNLTVDLDESQSNTGSTEQTGTAAGAASGNQVSDNAVTGQGDATQADAGEEAE